MSDLEKRSKRRLTDEAQEIVGPFLPAPTAPDYPSAPSVGMTHWRPPVRDYDQRLDIA